MQDVPVVLYDDRCSACTAFAQAAGFLAGSSIRTIGHYSPRGARMRASMLGPDALEMFWFVDDSAAYGGRAALLPLIRRIIYGVARGAKSPDSAIKTPAPPGTGAAQAGTACGTRDCSGVRDVFKRSASMLKNSRTIRLGPST